MKAVLTKDQEQMCNDVLNSGLDRHKRIAELTVGTMVTVHGIITKVKYLFNNIYHSNMLIKIYANFQHLLSFGHDLT